MRSFTSTQIIQQAWANWLPLVTPRLYTHAKSTMKCSLGWAPPFSTMWKSGRARSSAQTLLSQSGRKFPRGRSCSDHRRKYAANLLWMNKRISPDGLGATSKQQSNIVNFAERLPPENHQTIYENDLRFRISCALSLGLLDAVLCRRDAVRRDAPLSADDYRMENRAGGFASWRKDGCT